MSDAFEWAKGAVTDVWDAAGGQNKFRAKAYDPAAVQQAQSPWLQDLDAAASNYAVDSFGQTVAQEANRLNNQNVNQWVANTAAGFDPNASADRLDQIGSETGSALAAQAAGLNALEQEAATAPSYADAATNAAMSRASSDAVARAASARGANSALAMRDAAAMSAGASRQAAVDAGALKANEMNQRLQTRGNLLSQAAGVTGQAGQVQGTLTGAAGDQRRMGMQAGTQAMGQVADSQRADASTRGTLYGNAGQLTATGQGQRQDAMTAGLSGATQGQQILAGSHDNAQNANAGITANNAAGKQKITAGALTMGGSMLADASDVRVKQDIQPLSADALDVYQPDQRNLPKTWDAPAVTAPSVTGGGEEKKGNGLFGKALMLGAKAMLSDERAKEDISPIVMMAVDPEANREALGPVKPYQYRYKEDLAAAAGVDTEPRVGIMAQDLEQSPAGEAVVHDGPVKTLDQRRALGFSLAAAAGLDKRLRDLEAAVGGRG